MNSLLWISYGILWVVVLVLGAGMIVMLREGAITDSGAIRSPVASEGPGGAGWSCGEG